MITKKFNSLEDSHPKLCMEWDYVKNDILEPQNVSASTGKNIWWKCKRGHSFREKITNRINGIECPKCLNNISTNEKDIMNILGINPETIYTSDNWNGCNNIAECDGVFIEEKVIIEYDGYYWHKDKITKDTMKTLSLIDSGFYVIRIREKGLPSLVNSFSHYSYTNNYYEFLNVSICNDIGSIKRNRQLRSIANKVNQLIDYRRSLLLI